jgi:hypothetical protein
MYLKGTKAQCEAYNQEVINKEHFVDSTTGYSKVDAHQNGVDFSILIHPKYKSELEIIPNQDGWFKETEI